MPCRAGRGPSGGQIHLTLQLFSQVQWRPSTYPEATLFEFP